MKLVAIVAALAVLVASSAALRSLNTAIPTPGYEMRKKNAGPASEFPMYQLPDPRTGGITSNIHTREITLAKATADASAPFTWEGTVLVDSSTLAQLTFFSRVSDLSVEVKLPNARSYVPADVLSGKFKDQSGKVIENSFGLGGDRFPSTTYYFLSPKQGQWSVRLSTSAVDSNGPHVMLMTFNESPVTSDAYLGSFESLKQGNTVQIRANLFDNTLPRLHPSAVIKSDSPLAQVESVLLDLVLPDGSQQRIPMNDNASHGDLLANDGVYGAQFTANEIGNYVAEVKLSGNIKGIPFERNSLHMVSVVRSDLVVNTAQITDRDSERFVIHLVTNAEATALTPEDDVTHRAYAEVWGTTSSGMVPVCWVSGMTDLAAVEGGKLAFDLELNARWLTQAGATEPLELRNVYVQERNSWIPVSTIATLPVSSNGNVERKVNALRLALTAAEANVITDEMRYGVNPFKSGKATTTATTDASVTDETGHILLVHGYCAPANNFPPEQFTNSAVFQDFNQNRPTDLFARLIKEQGDVLPAFAIVAHSHGGLASTHLNAAYWSNLNVRDDGTKPLVQSVGSPYQGVPVSGLIAALGKALGMGCGSIEDLTYDGAKLWLAGVPAEQRKDTYYYTTQYETGHLVNYCNIASNAVLAWPNDGVTEVENNQFPGANNMGHKKSWCHSEGMHYPGQAKDPERNAYMNAHAKR